MGRKRNSPSTACAACSVSAKAAISPGEVGQPAAANAMTWCCWRMSGRPLPSRTPPMAVHGSRQQVRIAPQEERVALGELTRDVAVDLEDAERRPSLATNDQHIGNRPHVVVD